MPAKSTKAKEAAEAVPEEKTPMPEGAVFSLPGSELSWRDWLRQSAPSAAGRPLAPHQVRAWEWFEALEAGTKPEALIECWFRGGGKSTTVELALARQAVRGKRRFALYVSSTQKSANRHVQAVAATMERVGVGRAVNKYGFSKGWSAETLRTHNGFNVLSLGLDVAVRGIKLDEFRPDIIILDDIDELGDSLEVVEEKLAILRQSILQAGAVDVAVAFFQNAIHQHSIMSRCLDGTADLLRRRRMAPPVKAVENLTWETRLLPDAIDGLSEYVITGGMATWEGKPLSVCEAEMNDTGIVSFLRECQHETGVGGRFFSDWDEKRHVVFGDAFDAENTHTFLGGYDWGYGAPCCFLLAGVDARGRVLLLDEVYEKQLTNAEQADKVLATLTRWKLKPEDVTIWADPSMWALKTDHAGRRVADVHAFHSVGLRFVKASNARRGGWQNVRRYLKDVDREPDQPAVPFLRVVKGKCANLIRTIPQQVFAPTDVEDLDSDGDDHAVDALRYLLSSRPRSAPAPRALADPTGPPPPGQPDVRPSWLRAKDKPKRKL